MDDAILAQLFRPAGHYEQLADELLLRSRWRRWGRTHWLCTQLEDAARTLSLGRFVEQTGRSVSDGLRALGIPRFMVDALVAGAGATVRIAFGTTSADTVAKLLRVLIPLVCPDLARCPAEDAAVTMLLAPGVSAELRSVVKG